MGTFAENFRYSFRGVGCSLFLAQWDDATVRCFVLQDDVTNSADNLDPGVGGLVKLLRAYEENSAAIQAAARRILGVPIGAPLETLTVTADTSERFLTIRRHADGPFSAPGGGRLN
jgi:hypothetical protein